VGGAGGDAEEEGGPGLGADQCSVGLPGGEVRCDDGAVSEIFLKHLGGCEVGVGG